MKRLYISLPYFLYPISFYPHSRIGGNKKVNYKMDIDLDVNTHRYAGRQKLIHSNNSPDVLSKVYYHLYLNTFPTQ